MQATNHVNERIDPSFETQGRHNQKVQNKDISGYQVWLNLKNIVIDNHYTIKLFVYQSEVSTLPAGCITIRCNSLYFPNVL